MREKIVIAILIVCFCNTFIVTSANKEIALIEKARKIYESEGYTDWYYKPSNYSELVSWYLELESQYPNYIEVFKANELYNTGNITGGYDAYYVRITNESLGFHKPEVLFLGSPHGDETVGTIGMYWFADWLTRYAFHPDYDNPQREWLKWLIDHREIYFEISHNPWGFDHKQRYDANGWDLNREADYDGPGSPTGGIWASINGKTLRRFINNHTIRIGCDFHGGARMLLYPWAETHSSIVGTSPISGASYSNAPPDFYFYDASLLRCGEFIGNLVGDGYLNENNIGTIGELIWYSVYGGICPWTYGADVIENQAEDEYVEDEIFGNYPGAGILWVSPEMSNIKDPPESDFGNDTVPGYGMEVRRFILHQTDLAQPYIRWLPGTVENNAVVMKGENITFKWEVNGCLVVDHTYIQWGTSGDPINYSTYSTPDHDEHEGDYTGGTGWDNASDGVKEGVVYVENITINTPGAYYFVAKAKVDQIYGNVLAPYEYGNNPYLRIIKERTNSSYYEVINGTDGTEVINGKEWWYSPIIRVIVIEGANLSYYPQSYDFGIIEEGQVYETTFQIWNSGDMTLYWQLNDEYDWLTYYPMNGSTEPIEPPETIHVYINTTGLEPGFYSGKINITSNGGNGTFNVTFIVRGAILEYHPKFYYGDILQGETALTYFEIWNNGTDMLNYSLYEDCDWLDIYPKEGNSTGEHDFITVEINANISEGVHKCSIDITSNGGNGTFNVTINVIPVISQIIELKKGWNLITIPCQNNWTAKTLGQNISYCKIISRWNSSTQSFTSYLVGISPDELDFDIEDGKGYFIYVENVTSFAVEGIKIFNVSIPLHVGWNLIGWFNNVTKASLLAENINGCSIIAKWNTTIQRYQSYLVGISPPEYDFAIERGMGLFVYTTKESIWHG